MPIAPQRPALVCNRNSGSHDNAVADAIEQICRDAGAPLVRTFHIPDDALPDPHLLGESDIDFLLVWTGDGTINAAASAAARWDGAILPLPGGTQNLLSKALHGDRPVADILRDVWGGAMRRIRPPIIRSAAGDAFITIAAGPATRWAEIRETLRGDGLVDASQAVPAAIDDSFNAPGVRIGSDGKDYQAIILTPTRTGIRADGAITGTTGDLIQHGLAWIAGDYRNGPGEPITTDRTLTLYGDAPISMELDGELTQIAAPATFRSAISPIDIVATLAQDDLAAAA